MGPTPVYGARAEKPPKNADFAMKQTNICRLSGDIKTSDVKHRLHDVRRSIGSWRAATNQCTATLSWAKLLKVLWMDFNDIGLGVMWIRMFTLVFNLLYIVIRVNSLRHVADVRSGASIPPTTMALFSPFSRLPPFSPPTSHPRKQFLEIIYAILQFYAFFHWILEVGSQG